MIDEGHFLLLHDPPDHRRDGAGAGDDRQYPEGQRRGAFLRGGFPLRRFFRRAALAARRNVLDSLGIVLAAAAVRRLFREAVVPPLRPAARRLNLLVIHFRLGASPRSPARSVILVFGFGPILPPPAGAVVFIVFDPCARGAARPIVLVLIDGWTFVGGLARALVRLFAARGGLGGRLREGAAASSRGADVQGRVAARTLDGLANEVVRPFNLAWQDGHVTTIGIGKPSGTTGLLGAIGDLVQRTFWRSIGR